MSNDEIHHPDQLALDDGDSSLFGAQNVVELYDHEFLETLNSSEVGSISNSPYAEIDSFSSINGNTNVSTATVTGSSTTTTRTSNSTTNNTRFDNFNNSNMSMYFNSSNELNNVIATSMDFSSANTLRFVNPIQEQFDLSQFTQQMAMQDAGIRSVQSGIHSINQGPVISSVFEDEGLSSVPAYQSMNHNPSHCNFPGPHFGAYIPPAQLGVEHPGIFAPGAHLGSELQHRDLDYQGDNAGMFCSDTIHRFFSPGELPVLTGDASPFVGGPGCSSLPTEIPLEVSSFKIGKLSVEERRGKIERYLKKRNERNFSKKIKYACRKTLADSRPRVRGRFAKNDDFGENSRGASGNQDEEDDDYED